MKLDLDELERLEKAATPGEWENGAAGFIAAFTERIAATESVRYYEDAALISALRNAAPALLAAAREGERLRVLARRAHALLRIPDRSVWQYASASTEHAHVLEQLERAALAGKGEG